MSRFVFFILISSFSFLHANTPILVIHSYHDSYMWSANQDKGFKQVLDNQMNLYPLYSTEYIGTKRRSFDQEYEQEFVHYMTTKYKGYKPKLIYVTDDDALHFMLHNKERLFPSVPLVFSGVNDLSKRDIVKARAFSGVFEEQDIDTNIKLIKILFPQEKEIVLLGDNSTTANILEDKLLKELETSGLIIHSIHSNDYQTTLEQLKSFKGKIVVPTTIGGFKTADGGLIPLKQAISEIKNIGNFILIAFEDTYVQQGAIGGFVNNGEIQGTKAAEMALKILKDPNLRPSESIVGLHNFMFDVKALNELDITLPEEIAQKSLLINKPESFVHKYANILVTLIYTLIAVIIFGSLYFARYMHRSRNLILEKGENLAIITESMDKAQAIANLGNWDWNIKTNSLWWSDEIYRIFGLEPQEFEATYDAFLSHVHPNDQEKVNKAVNDALEHKSNYHIIHRIVQKDGTERHVVEEGSLRLDEKGEPSRMIGVVHDITEQKNASDMIEASEKKYRDFVENSMVGIYRTDLSGKILYVNPALAKILACDSVDEVIGENSLRMYNSPQDREKFIQELQKTGRLTNYELIAHDKNNKPIPIMLNAILEGDTLTGMMIDMSQLRTSQAELEKLSKVVEQIDDSVAITDNMGVITYANQAFYDHTGYSKEEVLGNTPRILKSGHHDIDFYKDLWKTILKGEVFRATFINKKKNGDLFYEKKTITPLKDELNNTVGYVSSGKDTTMETMMHQEIEYIASTDKLTGLHNRHKFEELFILELERARRFEHPLSLIILDIDHFKAVNDTFGHDVGDKVLKSFADIIQIHIRKLDILARWGGEEFLVLAPNTDLDHVQILAEKLRLAVEEFSFAKVQNITISAGISQLEKDDSFDDLLKRADKALYHAKENGRNQVSSTFR